MFDLGAVGDSLGLRKQHIKTESIGHQHLVSNPPATAYPEESGNQSTVTVTFPDNLDVEQLPTTTTNNSMKQDEESNHLDKTLFPAPTAKCNEGEELYLSGNKDVATAVGSGDFKSGFHHWESKGRQDGRNYYCNDTILLLERYAPNSWGHWEYNQSISPPYIYSSEVCNNTCIKDADCTKTESPSCPDSLMNWQFMSSDGTAYPKFNVDGFRNAMRNKSIVFVGDSIVRQQVTALTWNLGHQKVKWESPQNDRCTKRICMKDTIGNITICLQTMHVMLTQEYSEGNLTLARGFNDDSSCVLELTAKLSDYDLVFVQGMAHFQSLANHHHSSSAPLGWIAELTPLVYKDAMGKLLSDLSEKTRTVLVLGQIATSCWNKTEPEEFHLFEIPSQWGMDRAPKMWAALLNYLDEEKVNVQIVDARDPLLQSVHAHPDVDYGDCLHFCMNSAALNIYLDMYWVEVFSKFAPTE
jgi:hypothetical protein